ncbi:MAG: NosD domain-containing protein, partial [Promethearchaeota archaeon]
TCGSNSYGIYLSVSLSNLVVNNTCSGSTSHGIYLDGSEYNDIQWNGIVDSSTSGADVYGIGNVFNYNYWSDYAGNDVNGDGIGDTSYSGSGFGDSHPLMYLPTPPKWAQQPPDRTVEFAFSFFHCSLNLTCPSPVVWQVNNTMFFVDGQGIVTTRTILPIGIYALSVVATNIYGSTLPTSFRIIVLDTTSPGWLIIPTDQTLEYGESFDYQVAVIDLSGIENWEISDTVHFTLTASDHSVGSTARLANATALEPGVHYLQITASDPYDNFCTATIAVRVLEETGTTTTATTTTTTSTESDAINPAMTFVLGTGVGGVAVVVIVLAVLRRRRGE